MNNKAWLLKIAAEVEADPSRWTKGQYARDASGRKHNSRSPSAVCWCADGFQFRDDFFDADITLEKAAGMAVYPYNDSLANAADFVAWFRAAAELCE